MGWVADVEQNNEEPQNEEPGAEAQGPNGKPTHGARTLEELKGEPEGRPEGGDEGNPEKVEKAARKTFITDKQAEAGEYKPPFTIHDLLIPGGKPAKLARIPDVKVPDLRLSELLFRFKFRDPTPAIVLVGGWGTRAYIQN